jgi:hypothetical protein
MLNDMIFLTYNALDRDNAAAVKAAGLPMGADGDPLTELESNLLAKGGFGIPGVPHANLLIGHTVLYHDAKYLAPCVEFHFAEADPSLPDRERQLAAANEAWERMGLLVRLGIHATVEPDACEQDRHILWVLIPMNWALVQFRSVGDYLRYVKQILSP